MLDNVKTCECGLTYLVGDDSNERNHTRYHEECFDGPTIPEIAQIPASGLVQDLTLHVIAHSVPQQLREAFAGIAMIAQRSTPNYKAGFYGTETEEHVRMYLLATSGRGVGMAIISQDNHFWHFKWQLDRAPELASAAPTVNQRSKIVRLWIANNFRRRGLATELVRAACEDLHTDPSCVGWELPFTPLGAAVVKKLCAKSFWGSGDGDALFHPTQENTWCYVNCEAAALYGEAR